MDDYKDRQWVEITYTHYQQFSYYREPLFHLMGWKYEFHNKDTALKFIYDLGEDRCKLCAHPST